MKLVVDLPPDLAGVTLATRGPRPRPYDARAWLTEALERGRRPDSVRVLARRDAVTDLGWPMELLDVLVAVPGGGRQVELVALYRFLHHVAAAALTGDVLPPGCAEVLATGRPDWRGDEIIALDDLWR